MDLDINVKSKTIKLLEKITENFYDLELGKDFLDIKVQHIKGKIGNWTSLMTGSFAI